MSLQWGVVGTGAISRSVVSDLALAGEKVLTVHSRTQENADSFAAEFGISAAVSDLDVLLADPAIDIVYIATPFATHHRLVIQALRAGKHVLVEKPIALDAAQAAEMFAEAHRAGRFLMEAMWLRFNPAFLQLQALVDANRIGPARTIRAGFGIPWPRDSASRWDPHGSPGALLDQGIYPVTLAQALLGVPQSITASGTVQADGIDVTVHSTLSYAGGERAEFTVSMAEFADPSASVAGRAGWIRMPGMFWAAQELEVHAGDYERLFIRPEVIAFPFEGHGYVPMLRAVSESVLAGEIVHPLHDADSTIQVMQTLDLIRHAL